MGSLTPDFRKSGTWMTPSPAPFLTPRPERRRPDSRGSEWNHNRQDKDKEVNVQVLLRCRCSLGTLSHLCFLRLHASG